MDARYLKRNSLSLGLWLLLALVYLLAGNRLTVLSAARTFNGILGVLLGLYICSHPAVNAVNVLFFERRFFYQVTINWQLITWGILNLVVLFAGWLVIVMGATVLASPAH